jgi:hypothetical protein
MRNIIAFFKTAGVLGGGSMIFAVILFGISIEEHFRDKNVSPYWLVFGAAVAFCFGAYQAWNRTREELEKERTRNEGSRVEGKIDFALLDQKDKAANGTILFNDSVCFVTVLVWAENMNPAPAWFNTYANSFAMLSLEIANTVYWGSYEMISVGQTEFTTTLTEIKIKNITDFFLRYQREPMQDGLPNNGWLRFRFIEPTQIMLAAKAGVPVTVILALKDTRNKTHQIKGSVVLQLNKIRHCSEPPA